MLDKDLEIRIRDMALSTDLSAAEIHRRIRAEPDRPKVSYRIVGHAVRIARATSPDARRADPAGMAGRILALLNADLTRLEAASGPVDLNRLDQIAATLRRLEPIRPKGEERQVSSLRSLAPKVEHQAGAGQ